MSELKSQIALLQGLSYVEYRAVYLKSEADKVIVEKDKQLRHHKYKRCLSMAKICLDLSPRTATLKKYDKKSDLFINFYDWWYKRWTELAEKFKEA